MRTIASTCIETHFEHDAAGMWPQKQSFASPHQAFEAGKRLKRHDFQCLRYENAAHDLVIIPK